jgi:deazaflavin-dependent oxidoreductase (nitroreductase family)
MPLPYWVGHFNMRITNRIMNRLAPRLPGFGVVIHTGRTSYRTYYTPVNVFRRGDHFIVALTYSQNADWVKNVLKSGGCKMVTRGRLWRLANPRIFHDEQRTIALGPVHYILGVLRVSDFLDLVPEELAHNQQESPDQQQIMPLNDHDLRFNGERDTR